MNNFPVFINNTLSNHAAKALFNVRLIDYAAGEIVLGFQVRNEFSSVPEGALGCIVDCVVRSVSYEPIGRCTLSEYEITCHEPMQGKGQSHEFIASAHIGAADDQHAAFYCAIYVVEGAASRLIAESQGTLSADCAYKSIGYESADKFTVVA